MGKVLSVHSDEIILITDIRGTNKYKTYGKIWSWRGDKRQRLDTAPHSVEVRGKGLAVKNSLHVLDINVVAVVRLRVNFGLHVEIPEHFLWKSPFEIQTQLETILGDALRRVVLEWFLTADDLRHVSTFTDSLHEKIAPLVADEGIWLLSMIVMTANLRNPLAFINFKQENGVRDITRLKSTSLDEEEYMDQPDIQVTSVDEIFLRSDAPQQNGAPRDRQPNKPTEERKWSVVFHPEPEIGQESGKRSNEKQWAVVLHEEPADEVDAEKQEKDWKVVLHQEEPLNEQDTAAGLIPEILPDVSPEVAPEVLSEVLSEVLPEALPLVQTKTIDTPHHPQPDDVTSPVGRDELKKISTFHSENTSRKSIEGPKPVSEGSPVLKTPTSPMSLKKKRTWGLDVNDSTDVQRETQSEVLHVKETQRMQKRSTANSEKTLITTQAEIYPLPEDANTQTRNDHLYGNIVKRPITDVPTREDISKSEKGAKDLNVTVRSEPIYSEISDEHSSPKPVKPILPFNTHPKNTATEKNWNVKIHPEQLQPAYGEIGKDRPPGHAGILNNSWSVIKQTKLSESKNPEESGQSDSRGNSSGHLSGYKGASPKSQLENRDKEIQMTVQPVMAQPISPFTRIPNQHSPLDEIPKGHISVKRWLRDSADPDELSSEDERGVSDISPNPSGHLSAANQKTANDVKEEKPVNLLSPSNNSAFHSPKSLSSPHKQEPDFTPVDEESDATRIDRNKQDSLMFEESTAANFETVDAAPEPELSFKSSSSTPTLEDSNKEYSENQKESNENRVQCNLLKWKNVSLDEEDTNFGEYDEDDPKHSTRERNLSENDSIELLDEDEVSEFFSEPENTNFGKNLLKSPDVHENTSLNSEETTVFGCSQAQAEVVSKTVVVKEKQMMEPKQLGSLEVDTIDHLEGIPLDPKGSPLLQKFALHQELLYKMRSIDEEDSEIDYL